MLYGLVVYYPLSVGLAFLTALVVSLVGEAWLIRLFRRKNVIEDTSQPDHAGLNAIQSEKKNIPTMGGLVILSAIFISTILWSPLRSNYVLTGLLVLAVLGAAGFVDDYIKLKHKPSRGLTKTQKLAIQFVLGGVVGYMLRSAVSGTPNVPAPWYGTAHWRTSWGYIPWCGFVMAATSNAVNLTDGLDGLAGGLCVFAAIPIALASAPFTPAVHCTVILAGAILGFLWFNCHPAQIFMGDTGSLPLGGLLAYAALADQAELILLVAGAVFFIEEMTVAMQIASYKLTKRRIFPITPIHHYFQLNLKWPEEKIVARAWILGIASAVLAFWFF